jgi:acyl dehydratase
VFIGDRIEIAVTVKHKSEGTRTLLLRLEARNQHEQLVMDGEGVVTVLAQAGGSQQ